MNIRNTVRTIALAGVAAAIPLAAQAADTSTGGILGYASGATNNSDLTAGVVTSRCSDAGSGSLAIGCGTVASEGAADDGASGEAFLQETITSGDGTTYVRTVILETSAEGIIAMENFVEMGGAGGLRGHQLQTDGTFSLDSELNTGTFNTSAADGVDITQALSDGDLSQNDFWFHENASDLGATVASDIGRDVALAQTVGNVADGTERFVKVVHEGNSIPTFSFTVNGVNFSDTTATQDIAVTWVGTNLGSTFGLEDVLANGGASTEAGTGNDSLASAGFTGTSANTSLGFGWDAGLNFHGVQPSF
jgi:hypothetical protein